MRTISTIIRHPVASWRLWRDVYRTAYTARHRQDRRP